MSNHIHLLAKVPTRKAMGDALRFLASRIAVEIGKGKFWIARAWSRPVTSRRDLDRATLYIATNAEREGIYDNTIDGYCIQNGMLVDEIRISAE